MFFFFKLERKIILVHLFQKKPWKDILSKVFLIELNKQTALYRCLHTGQEQNDKQTRWQKKSRFCCSSSLYSEISEHDLIVTAVLMLCLTSANEWKMDEISMWPSLLNHPLCSIHSPSKVMSDSRENGDWWGGEWQGTSIILQLSGFVGLCSSLFPSFSSWWETWRDKQAWRQTDRDGEVGTLRSLFHGLLVLLVCTDPS